MLADAELEPADRAERPARRRSGSARASRRPRRSRGSASRCRRARRARPAGSSPGRRWSLGVRGDRRAGAACRPAGSACVSEASAGAAARSGGFRGRRLRRLRDFEEAISRRGGRGDLRGGSRFRHDPQAKGQPEESLTRHQPTSMPSRPHRGRECQCLQLRSPTSSALTWTQRCSAGSAIIRSTRARLLSSTSARRAISARAPKSRSDSASLIDSSSAIPSTRGPPAAPTFHSMPSRGKVEAKSSASCPSRLAIWRRRSARAGRNPTGRGGRRRPKIPHRPGGQRRGCSPTSVRVREAPAPGAPFHHIEVGTL